MTAPGSRPEITPRDMLEDMEMLAHLRLQDAVAAQLAAPALVWVTRRGMADGAIAESAGQDTSGVGVLWYRLGETHEVGDLQQERFDVGVVVADMHAPAAERAPSTGFYIRRNRRGAERTQIVNLLSVAAFAGVADQMTAIKPPLVTDLQRKLSDYYLHPLRVRDTL